ncbi:MAG: putative bifunctional diguanylate cyclase/phosphodiesterase [Campylobacterales bacterium]
MNRTKMFFFSYKRLTLALVSISLLVSIGVGIFAASMLKESAIFEMAKVDAKKSSSLVFESLYSAMEKGITKADLNRIIARLNGGEHDMNISVYRSQKVGQLFGDLESDKKAREGDIAVKKAMNGEDTLIMDENSIRYLYPIKAKTECLRCHTNVANGDINGVVDISYPITNIKVSLNYALNYFILFFVLFFIVTYAAFYYGLNKFLVSPLSQFVFDIKKAIRQRETNKKMEISSSIYELKNLEKSFNRMLLFLDKSRKKELEQVYKDAITGLPNRLKLREDLQEFQMPLLVILNIDSFKEINDFYGVKVGDFVLSELGSAIKSHCHLSEKVYRFAGDEYAILIDTADVPNDIEGYVDSLLDVLRNEVFMYNEYEISVHMTAGVAIGGKNILENADMALKQAKKLGKNFVFFDPSMQVSKQYEHNIKWTKILKEALDDGRVQPYFQPIMDIKTGKVEKFEALARLIDENGFPVAPYAFLSVAKKSKLYPHLTRAMLEKSFRFFELSQMEFSINISVEDIEDEVTREFIYEKLRGYPKPKRVIFEITESEGIENFAEVLDFIKSVKSIGAKIAIDDFGSGYSNFAYLMKLEVDYIKIDASIIKNIAVDRNSYIITKTIVDFCKQIGIRTVAEFVSDKEILDTIAELGVDYAQGYYIGEPRKDTKEWIS